MALKASLMLADHAQAVGGKLYICGGGWSLTGPEPSPFAIVADVKVPWSGINTDHTLLLELVDGDGQAVEVETPNGMEPLRLEASFQVSPAPGVKPGSAIDAPFAVNLAPQPCIAPGGLYEWRLTIDGVTREEWRVAFRTRRALAQAA